MTHCETPARTRQISRPGQDYIRWIFLRDSGDPWPLPGHAISSPRSPPSPRRSSAGSPELRVFLETKITNAGTDGTAGLSSKSSAPRAAFVTSRTTGSGYGCTAPGTTPGCQRDEAPCPLKIEERARPYSRDDHPRVRGPALTRLRARAGGRMRAGPFRRAAARGPARRDRQQRSQPEAQSAGQRRIASPRRAAGRSARCTPGTFAGRCAFAPGVAGKTGPSPCAG